MLIPKRGYGSTWWNFLRPDKKKSAQDALRYIKRGLLFGLSGFAVEGNLNLSKVTSRLHLTNVRVNDDLILPENTRSLELDQVTVLGEVIAKSSFIEKLTFRNCHFKGGLDLGQLVGDVVIGWSFIQGHLTIGPGVQEILFPACKKDDKAAIWCMKNPAAELAALFAFDAVTIVPRIIDWEENYRQEERAREEGLQALREYLQEAAHDMHNVRRRIYGGE